jgi:hypothetical protein
LRALFFFKFIIYIRIQVMCIIYSTFYVARLRNIYLVYKVYNVNKIVVLDSLDVFYYHDRIIVLFKIKTVVCIYNFVI